MANTYSKLYVHIVFVVKRRSALIHHEWKEKLYKYITGIIQNKNQKLMVINGMPDHIHILLGLKPDCNLSDLVRDIKCNTSRWINESKFLSIKFEWQTGFGAFSVGPPQLNVVINYILNQEEHHRKKSFRKELTNFLNEYEIEFNTEYLFDDLGDAPTELG